MQIEEKRKKEKSQEKSKDMKKDGQGPVMVSDTLGPGVHILGTWNVFSWANSIAYHYWHLLAPACLFSIHKSKQGP